MTIRELRISKKLTQAKMAEMIGVKPAVISRLENGRMSVSEEIADKVREVFGTEVGDPEKQVVKKISSRKIEIYIQSPLGGNITPEEIEARMPEGTEACFVRVDQNLIWWVRSDGETGAVEIWASDR